jgi:hypothetical protein
LEKNTSKLFSGFTKQIVMGTAIKSGFRTFEWSTEMVRSE